MSRVFITLITLAAVIGSNAKSDRVIIPAPLKPGARIAMVSPASSVKDEIVDSAYSVLMEMGYEPVIYPHAKGSEYGSYPASDRDRADDLMAAFADPTVDAIWCNRGGYGCVRLLPLLDMEVVRRNPKWLVGYSDISDLHAYMHKAAVASIHGPMSKHIASEPDSLPATRLLFKALSNDFPLAMTAEAHPYNKPGRTAGRLVGGNLITINGLAETPYDMLQPRGDEEVILFFEDISEQIYAIERILMRLQYSGILSKVKGIIIGQFTDYRHPTDDYASMEDMIHDWLMEWGYYDPFNPIPIVFNFPTGHVSDNYPMIVSAMAYLDVSDDGVTLTYPGY